MKPNNGCTAIVNLNDNPKESSEHQWLHNYSKQWLLKHEFTFQTESPEDFQAQELAMNS